MTGDTMETRHGRPGGALRGGVSRLAGSAALGAALLATPALAQESADYFRANCASCHTIGGGRLTGPDLKDVAERKDRAWLVRFVGDPKGMIDSGDPYAARLLQDSRGVIMPRVPGMNADRAAALLDLIAAESKLERSQFAGLEIPDTPFTPEQVTHGERLFAGGRALVNGGPGCVGCHTVKAVGGLGGGRLAPDLTRVYERLGGRRNLAMWLSAPATTTMQPLFRARALQPDEVLAITAYLEDAAKKGGAADPVTMLQFFLLSLGGAVVVLSSFGMLWKRRLRAVRRPLVRGEALGGEA